MYVIVRGGVRASKVIDGGRQTIRLPGPGEHVGELALLREAPRAVDVTALTDDAFPDGRPPRQRRCRPHRRARRVRPPCCRRRSRRVLSGSARFGSDSPGYLAWIDVAGEEPVVKMRRLLADSPLALVPVAERTARRQFRRDSLGGPQ